MASKSIRNIDLNLLIVFDAVYTAGNISHAARQLALTQPAVSNALTRLRDHFGDALFVRSGRGVKPTVRAQRMIAPVRDALRLIRQQVDGRDFDLAAYKRTFRIVIVDPLEPLLMPPLLDAILRHAPGVAIETRPPTAINMINEIVAGTLDLACYPFLVSHTGLVTVPVCPCDYVVVARRGHPAIGAALDLDTFMMLGHVGLISELRGHANIDRDITIRAGPRRIVYMVHKAWSIPAIVGNTDLVSTLPRRFAEKMAPVFGLEIHACPVPISEQHVHMMWHERNNDDPGHIWLRETMLNALAEPAGLPPQAAPTRRMARPAGRKAPAGAA